MAPIAMAMMAAVGCGGDAAPAATGDPAGSVRFGSPGGPSQGLDPHRSSQIEDVTFLAPLYDPLVLQTPTGKLAPGLATGWEFNDDGDVLTLHLRDGVTFHDGSRFDAEVVRANLERATTVEGSGVAALLAPLESVEVADPLTVHLHLSGPTATMPRILSERAGMMVSPAALDDPDLAAEPVGAGMFRLADYRPGDLIRYERFEGYWRPADVAVSQLEIVIQPDPVTRLSALRSGELDIATLDPPQFLEAAGAGLSTTAHETTGVRLLQLNRSRSEFGDVRVRRALNHAIDRASIVETLLLGHGAAAEQFYPESFPAGHVPDLVGRYPYDPTRARELLADAGLPDGFRFELVVPALPWIQQFAEVVQAQLAEVGITAELTNVELSQAATLFFVEQQGDAVIGACPCHTDPVLLAELYFAPDSFINAGGHVLDGFAQAYTAALRPAPEQQRRPHLHELMRVAVEQAGQVVLVQDHVLVATQPHVTGFRWAMSGLPDFRGVAVDD